VAAIPIFIDANVPMYAVGRPHEMKEPCRQVLALLGQYPEAFATDAEVLQEMVHRFRTSVSWQVGLAQVESFAAAMRGRIEPLQGEDVLEAVRIARRYPRLSARDLVHVAVMLRVGIATVVSADADFDDVAEIDRLDPRDVAVWRAELD
jgi:predicted nucleic acid-binding protein